MAIKGEIILADLNEKSPRKAITEFRKGSDDRALARAYRLAGMSAEAQSENAAYERLDKEAHAARVQPNPPQ